MRKKKQDFEQFQVLLKKTQAHKAYNFSVLLLQLLFSTLSDHVD